MTELNQSTVKSEFNKLIVDFSKLTYTLNAFNEKITVLNTILTQSPNADSKNKAKFNSGDTISATLIKQVRIRIYIQDFI